MASLFSALLVVAATAFTLTISAAESTERQAPDWCYYDSGPPMVPIEGRIPREPEDKFDLCWRAEHYSPGAIRHYLRLMTLLWHRMSDPQRIWFDPSGSGAGPGPHGTMFILLVQDWMRPQWRDPVNPRRWGTAKFPITGGTRGVLMNARNNAESITVSIYNAGMITVPDTRGGIDPGENNWRRPIAGYTWDVVVSSPTGCTPTATSPARASTTPMKPAAVKAAVDAVLADVGSCFP